METRSPVASSEITYSPGHNFPSDWTPAFASLRVSASSTKCRLPSSRILKMQKRRRIQTPNGDDVLGGQWSNYRINLVCWVQAARLTRAGTKLLRIRSADHFHFERAMRFIASAILRSLSRICSSMATLSSSGSSAGGGAGGGKGRNSGTIQISMATSKETTLAETHQRKYPDIHRCMKALFTI